MVCRRIPWLQEEVVDAGLIDGTDRSARVGICGEQRTLGIRIDVHCFLQKCDPVHARHALVCEQQGHAVIAHLQLFQQVQCPVGRIAPYDAILGTVLRAQVAFNRPQNIGVVIDTQ